MSSGPRSISLFAALMLSSLPVAAQTVPRPLTGVHAVALAVTVDSENPALRSDRVRTILELRLRTAGLTVLTPAEAGPSTTRARLDVTAGPKHSCGSAFSVTLGVYEFVALPRNGAIAAAELWRKGNVGSTGSPESTIEDTVGRLADEFVNQWLTENPRR